VKTTTVALASMLLIAAHSFAAGNSSKPLVVYSGSNSEVREPLYSKITSKSEWDKVWASHLGTSVDDAYRSAFEGDFDKCMVVAILQGNQINVRGVHIDSITEKENVIVVRFVDVYYQTGDEGNIKPPDRPFAFVVLPKTNKQIILEQGTSADGRLQLTWKELVRLN
jgi:hypothetical protein